MSEDSGQFENEGRTTTRPGVGWWIVQVLLTGVAGFFTAFGVSLLIASYGLGDPFSFIMTFFAASLMTMISIVMIIGLVLRMWRVARPRVEGNDEEAGS